MLVIYTQMPSFRTCQRTSAARPWAAAVSHLLFGDSCLPVLLGEDQAGLLPEPLLFGVAERLLDAPVPGRDAALRGVQEQSKVFEFPHLQAIQSGEVLLSWFGGKGQRI